MQISLTNLDSNSFLGKDVPKYDSNTNQEERNFYANVEITRGESGEERFVDEIESPSDGKDFMKLLVSETEEEITEEELLLPENDLGKAEEQALLSSDTLLVLIDKKYIPFKKEDATAAMDEDKADKDLLLEGEEELQRTLLELGKAEYTPQVANIPNVIVLKEKIQAYDPFVKDIEDQNVTDQKLDLLSGRKLDELLVSIDKIPTKTASDDLALLKSQRIRFSVDQQVVSQPVESSSDKEMILVVNNLRGDGSANQKLNFLEKLDIQQAVREAMIQGGNMELVKRAQFVIRGEQTGEIRLTLRPEHLGAVRINLSLDDGRILGRIVVANAEVKEAFAENMRDLRDSFLKHGFESAFDLEHQGERHQSREEDSAYHSKRLRTEDDDSMADILAYWQSNEEGK